MARSKKRSFCKRVTGLDFVLKLVGLLAALSIMHLWTTEDPTLYERLPAKSYFEWDLYFHTVIGYIFVLSGQLLLYFIGEIPSLVVQRVVLLYGAALFIICGVVGFANYFWLMKRLQVKMLAIALLCFFTAGCMMWDHLWQEEYFKDQPEEEKQSTDATSSRSGATSSRSGVTSSRSRAASSISGATSSMGVRSSIIKIN